MFDEWCVMVPGAQKPSETKNIRFFFFWGGGGVSSNFAKQASKKKRKKKGKKRKKRQVRVDAGVVAVHVFAAAAAA